MVINHHFFILLLALSLFSPRIIPIAITAAAAAAAAATFNVSTFLLPLNINNHLPPPPPPSPSSLLLKDVLNAIAVKQNWDLEEFRVSDLDVRNARVGSSQRYEFRIRVRKSDLEFQFSDEIDSWRKLGGKKKKTRFGVLVNEVSSKNVIKTFELDGPFELRVDGDDDDELSLLLPLNTTRIGLKRVLVGEGITVKVIGAREVSLFHTSDFGLPVNRSLHIHEDKKQFWPFSPSLCIPLPPIRLLGSASLVAYRTRNPDAYIETRFLSRDMIELLPEKCYNKDSYKKRACPIGSLIPRLALLEKLLKGVLGNRIQQNGVAGFLRAKITVSTLVRFQLELEKGVKDNDKYWSTLAEWRTKPRTERVRFEVVARVEDGKLKPVMLKKVRPFITAESASWSILMSNISFTKFPSVLVPPEALTLDVKW